MDKIEMKAVESSNIESVGYDAQTLFVKFKDGNMYRYQDVPAGTYRDLMDSESIGGHFHAHIKGQYKSEKVVLDDNGNPHPMEGAVPTSASDEGAAGNADGDTPAQPNTQDGEEGNAASAATSQVETGQPLESGGSVACVVDIPEGMVACTVTIFCAAGKMAAHSDRQSLENWAGKCPWAEIVTVEWLGMRDGEFITDRKAA